MRRLIYLWGIVVLVGQSGVLAQNVPRYNTEVYFKTDKKELKDAIMVDKLDEAIGYFVGKRPYIEVVGYCDERGDVFYNEKLSLARARNVAAYIFRKIPLASIIYLGKGELGGTPTMENRRVEIRFTRKSTFDRSQLKTFYIRSEGKKIRSGVVSLSDSAGRYTYEIRDGYVWVHRDSLVGKTLRVKSAGTFRQSIVPDASKRSETIVLAPIQKDSVVLLERLYFVGNEATFLPGAYPTLEDLALTLTEEPSLKLQIEGHTNAVGSQMPPEWHLDLSKQRAEAVKQYLVEQGISASRLAVRYFGSDRMVFPEAKTTSEQSANRRVEVRVTSYK
jgi:outer membrane protein OmpA-like peptidoglycan-associated protein